MPGTGLVSVIIPCFNARAWIGATLDSVFAQRGVDIEVILVDDGSQDGSAELVHEQFPQVTVYRTANRGPSSARNLGTQSSKGEFIQYLDADDLLAPDKLQTQLASLQSSGAEVAYGDWLKFCLLPDGAKLVKAQFTRQLGSSPEIDLFTGFWCPPAAYLIRRTVVDRVGGWHPNLPVIQDARFMLDCALQGASFIYCAGPMAEYRMHERGSVSTRSRAAFLDDCLRNALEVRE
jgi:glycosyltransferase involved in cell wall biosynthesis